MGRARSFYRPSAAAGGRPRLLDAEEHVGRDRGAHRPEQEVQGLGEEYEQESTNTPDPDLPMRRR